MDYHYKITSACSAPSVSVSMLCVFLISSSSFAVLLTTPAGQRLAGTRPRQFHLPATSAAGTRTLDAGPPVVQVVLARLYVLVYALGDAHKGVFHILAALGARLDVLEDAVAARPRLRLLPRNLSLVLPGAAVSFLRRLGEVGFVADEDDDNVRLGDLAEVVEPVGDVVKGGLAREVKDEERARGAAEVGAGDGFVRLLAGRVPQGELHVLLGVLAGVARGVGEAGWCSCGGGCG